MLNHKGKAVILALEYRVFARICTDLRSGFEASLESWKHPPSRSRHGLGAASPRPLPGPTCTPSGPSPPWDNRAPSASR